MRSSNVCSAHVRRSACVRKIVKNHSIRHVDTTDSVHVFLLESVHIFLLSSQCRKRSESSQGAARSHDVCCRLVDARAPHSPGRHYRMRIHLDWWRKVRPPPCLGPTDILCVRLRTKQVITFKDRVITSDLLSCLPIVGRSQVIPPG